MNKEDFEGVSTRLLEINEIVKKLDSSIRSDAFKLLEPYACPGDNGKPGDSVQLQRGSGGSSTFREFYATIGPTKPAERAHAAIAWLYTSRGPKDFSLHEIETLLEEIGELGPERLDMTLRNASKSGKKAFKPLGKGIFRFAIAGEQLAKQYMERVNDG